MKKLMWVLVFAAACVITGAAAEQKSLSENEFQEKWRPLENERNDADKLRRGRDLVRMHRLSSLQVKAIALSLSDDSARLEFATAAFPRVVDPENFYEVYDAFRTFSKVMRLHDRIRPSAPPVPPVAAPATVSPKEMKEILSALRKESFDNTRLQLARQMVGHSRQLFLSSQVKQMLDCFDFEPNKLELAKYAYDFTYDREKYFLVNEAFSFDHTKQSLARYIESHRQPVSLERP